MNETINMSRPAPEWFTASEEANARIMGRIADAVSTTNMKAQVNSAPMLAHWFVLDTLLLANRANRDGMHANALVLMRQCVEAISVIGLGVCRHPDAEAMLLKWDSDELTRQIAGMASGKCLAALRGGTLDRALVHFHARVCGRCSTLCALWARSGTMAASPAYG